MRAGKTAAATLRARGKSHARAREADRELRAQEIAGYTPRGHGARPCAGGKSREEGREERGEERRAAAGPGILRREVESPAAGAGIRRRGPSIVHPAAGSFALPPHAAQPSRLPLLHLPTDLRFHDKPLQLFPSRIRGC